MAGRWRIRHKLMFGLGLVVAIIALLLVGSLWGLLSYTQTMKSIGSKVAEQSRAEDLRSRIACLGFEIKIDPDTRKLEPDVMRERIAAAKEALAGYVVQLRDTLDRHRDPNKGYMERQLVEAMNQGFTQLEQAVSTALRAQGGLQSTVLLEQAEVRSAIRGLERSSDELRAQLYDDIRSLIDEARRPYRNSLVVVFSASGVGLCLLAGCLGFFYRQVLSPIGKLQAGAGRVAEGDFDHRIDVHTGDEMEDLATAFNDMTSRLQATYRDLAQQVNERSRQLVRSERLASVGFLAAGVAHEINNPLASIAFCSEALEGRLGDVLPTEGSGSEVIRKYLKMIQEEAFRCKSITQRLLEFSRTGERRREATDLCEVVQSVLEMVQHLQNSKGKRIVFEPRLRLRAWVNVQEVKSVVLNLVVNALDSMDEDGTLTITLDQHDGMAELMFTDTGCGMTPEVLENIFEPFFTRSRTGKGTGLGLSISHRIITGHGGEIEATSAGASRGSTFVVRLPLRPVEFVKEDTLGHAAA